MKAHAGYFAVWFLTFIAASASAAVLYVNLSNLNPVPPYADWSTAATNIQDAIDASSDGDLILVTNGLYATGGRVVYGALTNRVVINKAVTVQSVNGPTKTFVQGNPSLGNSAVRCVYLTNNATLLGFTLTNGATRLSGDSYEEQSGGGIWCESTSASVSNCVVVKNVAFLWGGGTVSGTLISCTLTNNTTLLSSSQGGSALAAILTNCIIVHNSAAFGGGAASNILFNCTLTNNSARTSGGGAFSCVLSNCFFYGNSAANGGGAACGTLTGCTLTNNIAYNGGGSSSNTLINCTLMNNIATNSGGGAFSCALSNCKLMYNFATNYGGGTFACTLSNCTLSGNSAFSSAVQSCGGGACFGTLYNCMLSNNAAVHGGGTGSNTLINCTLFSNTAMDGGGAFSSTLNSCVLNSNTASLLGGGSENGNLVNCLISYNLITGPGLGASGADHCNLTNCTVFENFGVGGGGPVSGTCVNCIIDAYLGYFGAGPLNLFNCWITNDPVFVNLDAGDFHLQSNSPCINSGNNAYVSGTNDLDGNPRIAGGTVDIGAYEYQTPASVISYAWLQQYGLPTDGSVDYADSDGDGMNNWQEWIAGTNPTNAASVLSLESPAVTVSNATIAWSSVTNRTYYVQRSSDLSQADFSFIQSNIVGQINTTSYTDTNAVGSGPFFYRVGVQ